MVVKFLPREFALILANIILMVKPVEAEFSRCIYGSCPQETLSFLFTFQGVPMKAEKMTSVLSETYGEYGLHINVADFRHALEAFAHKLRKPCRVWDPFLASMANHSVGTSAHYGRDQNCMVHIPADVTEANAESCNVWNTIILGSPSKKVNPVQTIPTFSGGQAHLRQNMEHNERGEIVDRSFAAGNVDDRPGGVSTQESLRNTQPRYIVYEARGLEPQPLLGCGDSSSPAIHSGISAGSSVASLGILHPPHKEVFPKRSPQEIQLRKDDAIKRRRLVECLSPMQKEAMECLQKNDGNAIIIMPTGSGKTYLMWTHCDKSQCSIVFAPYRILVQQLADLLQGHGITFTWPFQDMRVSMCQILSTAKYIVMPYEAAPHADAVGLLESLHSIGRLGPVWIDEVCT